MPFCQLCERSLHDFRGKPLKEVVAYTNQNKGCGIFDYEHVHDEPITLLSFSSFRRWAVALSTFFAAETSFAQDNQDTSPDTVIVRQLETVDIVAQHSATPEVTTKKEQTNRELRKYWRKWNERNAYRTDYGLFLRRRFPFFSFKNYIVLRPVVSFWHDQQNHRTIHRRSGLIFFSKF